MIKFNDSVPLDTERFAPSRVGERSLLACCAEVPSDLPGKSEMIRLMGGVRDTDRLIDMANAEGMAGLLYRHLEIEGLLGSLDPNQTARLRKCYLDIVLRNMWHIAEMRRIIAALIPTGICIVLLKGIALLQEIYQDIGLRPMNDVDFWVRPWEYQTLVDTLERLGFHRDSLYPDTFRNSRIVLDVHTHPFGADRIRRRGLLFNTDLDTIRNRSITLTCQGVTALSLDPLDMFIHLSFHAVKHGAGRLIWLTDLKLMLSGCSGWDIDALVSRAKEMGQYKIVSHVLCILGHQFGSRLPMIDTGKAAALGRVEKILIGGVVTNGKLPPWGPFFLMTSGKRLITRGYLLFEYLFPHPVILRQAFPGTGPVPLWQLYVRRILQILRILAIYILNIPKRL